MRELNVQHDALLSYMVAKGVSSVVKRVSEWDIMSDL